MGLSVFFRNEKSPIISYFVDREEYIGKAFIRLLGNQEGSCLGMFKDKKLNRLRADSNRTDSYVKTFKSVLYIVRESCEGAFMRNNVVKKSRGGPIGMCGVFKGGTCEPFTSEF